MLDAGRLGMKPYYDDGRGIVIYHGDAREILPTIKTADLLLTDPPFGVGNFVQTTGNVRGDKVDWNNSTPDNSTIELAKSKSIHSIIWGANYLNCFTENGGAIVWIKNNPMPDFSKAEIASCSFYKKTEIVEITWTNFVNSKESKHPCERPVGLYRWCIRYGPNPRTILDPFMGSGSVLVAAKDLGRAATGIEINEKYCEMAAQRLSQEVLQLA